MLTTGKCVDIAVLIKIFFVPHVFDLLCLPKHVTAVRQTTIGAMKWASAAKKSVV